MYSSNSFQRVPSPTQSDIQSKRSHFKVGMEEELEVEKIQKLRRLDSPTSHTENGINYVQVPSPKYISQKTSPKTGGTQHRRSASPKLFPPPIQKFLNGKGPTTASDALRKLKVPSKKNHRENLEKMHLLGLIQAHEVESSLLFRRSVSPSASQYSTSPITSPRMEVSPQRDGNTSMAYEGNMGMQASPQLVPLDGNMEKANSVNNCELESNFIQNTPSMMSSTMSNQSTYGNSVPKELCQPSQNYYAQNSVGYPFQLNPENQNQMAYHHHNQQMNGYPNNWNQGQQQPQNFQMINNHHNNNSRYENRNEQEGRERTTSFLGNQGVPFDLSQFQFANQRPADNLSALKSKAEDQLATIHQLMQDKRKVSGGCDSPKDMMQMFRKRNSNPENIMRSPEPQPLYPQAQAPRWRNSLEAEPCFANNTFGSNFRQESFNKEQFQFQGVQQQTNMSMQAKGDMFQEGNVSNQIGVTQNQEGSNLYQNNGKSTTNTSNQDMFGFFSNEQNHQSSSQGHYSGSGSEGFLDPDAFLTADHPQDNEEFDMNITHTALTFMPQNDIFGDIVPDTIFTKFNGPGEFPDDDIGI